MGRVTSVSQSHSELPDLSHTPRKLHGTGQPGESEFKIDNKYTIYFSTDIF